MHSLSLGHDPYTDGVRLLEQFQRAQAAHPNAAPPLIYVYGPLTLPLLRWIASLPLWLEISGYWLLIAMGAAMAIRVGMRFVAEHERPVFLLLAPAAIFFPGLIQNDALFSGNVAYILYGLVFGAAAVGWRKGHWGWFYAATLLAACFKAPMLTMLAIPLFSARRQWVWAGATLAAWGAQFAAQWLLFPLESRHYMDSLERMFSISRDFGSSPAGLLADRLFDTVPYRPVLMGTYLLYAIPLLGILFYLSRRFFAGKISLEQWVPVLSIGVILLDPRIQEYDVAPITIMMGLVAWRFLAEGTGIRQGLLRFGFFFAVANLMAAYRWRSTECVVLVGLFAAGVATLVAVPARAAAPATIEIDDEESLFASTQLDSPLTS
jgi:hypothetical protein